MRRLLIIVLAVVVLLTGLAYVFRDSVLFGLMYATMKPSQPFSAAAAPPAPDYSRVEYWAALPDRADLADTLPGASVRDGQEDAQVDVFFIHPTTFYSSAGWNQPLPDANADAITDGYVLRGQASVFNSCCRVYAPRYRQATLFSFFDDSNSARQALDFAYGDVDDAFDYFIDHYSNGRPFILASHSQGSRHLAKLLKDRFDGTALDARLVAAYPIGYAITKSELPTDVPVCDSATQTGCVVTWNSVGPAARSFQPTGNYICVNPLTWRADGAYADFALNEGAVSYGSVPMNAGPAEMLAPRNGKIEPGAADAQCIDGRLVVSAIRSNEFTGRPLGRDNYHVYDYALFSMNLRSNANARVAAYLSEHGGVVAQPADAAMQDTVVPGPE